MADNSFKMTCPACKREMAAIYLIKENICLNVCFNGCGGIFFDYKEFDKVLSDFTPIVRFFENREFEKTDTKPLRYCPACFNPMSKQRLSFDKNIIINSCNTCETNFLDYEEYKKIEDKFEKRGLEARKRIEEVCVLVKNQQELQALKEKYHPTKITKIKQWLREKLVAQPKKRR